MHAMLHYMIIMTLLSILLHGTTTKRATATASFVSFRTTTTTTTTTATPFLLCNRERRKNKNGIPAPRFLCATSSSPGSNEKDIESAAANGNGDDDVLAANDNGNDDVLTKYRNHLNQRDQVFSAISGDGGIKVTVCTVRNLINDILFNNYHQPTTATTAATSTMSTSSTSASTGGGMSLTMTAIPTDALGRTMICALLMANGIQKEQMVQITMNGNGPLRGVVAIANANGSVRGYVGTPQLRGVSSIHDAVGTKGSVQIVKNHLDWPRPYNGITAIRHGDIDRDVGLYLAESEQRSCALAAATALTSTGGNAENGSINSEVLLCNAAGGYLVEQLPDVSKETVAIVERNLAKLVELDGSDKLPTNLLLQGQTPLDIANMILKDLDLQPLDQILDPSLACECTEERLWRALSLLPATEVQEILDLEQKVEARCQFCGREYRIGADAVRERLFSRSAPDNAK